MSAIARASSTVLAISLLAISIPSSFMAFLNSKRSSPRSMASTWTPKTLTLYLSKTPALCNSAHKFNADCPPKLGNRASGLSFSIICVNLLRFNGSI